MASRLVTRGCCFCKFRSQYIRFPSINTCKYIATATETINKEDDAGSKNENTEEKFLYKDHIPTSSFQKLLLTIGSASLALYSPYRDDMVAVLGETTGFNALKNIRQKMLQNPEGQLILKEKPRINSQTVDLNYLRTLPENSLGRAYLKFLDDNGVSPDTRMDVQFVDDVELAYVMQRYREVHDLMHTVLNMPTNMLGEVAVKWIEAIQTGLPMCSLGALFGPLRFAKQQRKKYMSVLPWAIRCGYHSSFLMNIYFEKRWDQPLKAIQDEMNIEQPPDISIKKKSN